MMVDVVDYLSSAYLLSGISMYGDFHFSMFLFVN